MQFAPRNLQVSPEGKLIGLCVFEPGFWSDRVLEENSPAGVVLCSRCGEEQVLGCLYRVHARPGSLTGPEPGMFDYGLSR